MISGAEFVTEGNCWGCLERETGFEPATSTLARLHSTTELFPLIYDAAQNVTTNFANVTKKKWAVDYPKMHCGTG
jgi:hypothetical protein